MARNFLTGLRLVNLDSDPASGSEGELYFNTSSSVARIYKSGAWTNLDTTGGGSSLTQEEIQDYVAPLFTNATNTNVVATYDDANNVINLNTSGSLVSIDTITYPDYIVFDTTPENTSASVGTLAWDTGESNLSLQLTANSNIGIGQELIVLCNNGEATTLNKGEVVRLAGAQGQRPLILRAYNTNDNGSALTVGIVNESIAAGAEGFVVTQGIVRDINTNGFNEGDTLYLSSSAGVLTNIKPSAPEHLVIVGVVSKKNAASGRIYVKPINGFELDELHNVSIDGTPADNELLAYSSASGLWINQTADEANIVDKSTTQTITGSKDFSGLVYLSYPTIYSNANNNSKLGSAALNVLTSGVSNTAIGHYSLVSNTSGGYNSGLGAFSLQANTTGQNNVAIGYSALNQITTAIQNVALGYGAGQAITSGDYNVIIGGNSGSTISGTSNNIILSDGEGNIRGQYLSASTGWILGTIKSGTWNGSVIGTSYGGTGLSSYSVGDIIYASASTTLSKLAAGTNGHVLTLAAGIPSWAALPNSFSTIATTSGTSPVADSTSDTLTLSAGSGISVTGDSTTDTITIANTGYYSGGTDVPLADGGTNASLTASNGGIVYSTATAMAILSGTATAGQHLQSGASGAPSWTTATFPSTATSAGTILRADGTNWVATTATYPATTTVNQILYSSSANVISGITTANNQVLVTGATGIPAFSTTLPSGVTASSLTSFGSSPTLTTPTINTINVSASNTTAALWNTTLATGSISMGGALTSGSVVVAGGTTFAGIIAIANASTSAHTVNISNGAGTTNKTINIGTASTGGTTAIALGSSSGATSTIALQGAVTATSLTVTGAAAFNGGFTVDTTAFSVADVTGNTSIAGTLGVTGNTTLTGDLAVNGGDITTTAGTLNIGTTNAFTINLGTINSTAVTIGGPTATVTIPGKADIVFDTDGGIGGSGIIYAGSATPTSPAVGDIWIDSTSATPNSNILRWRKLATAGQTSVTGVDDNGTTLSYAAGYEQVYINGVLIYRGTDYTATNGTSITLTSGLVVNDTIEIIAPIFTYFGDYYTQGQSDARYPLSTSGTLTTPTIDTINTSITTTGTAALWNTGITTGSISIGGSLTTGSVSIASGTTYAGTISLGPTSGTTNKTINILNGSTAGTLTLNIGSNISTSTTNMYGATVFRGISGTEGGQIDLAPAGTGNTWYIDSFGASTPSFRVINGATSSLTIDSANTAIFTGIAYSSADSVILKTGNFTVNANEKNYNVTGTAQVTVTLPAASSFAGREINIVNKAAFAIVSASSNVVPRTSNTAGTAICSATAGSFARLVSNGTSWYIVAGA